MAEKKIEEQRKQQTWENAFREKQRADQLAQQQLERQLAEKEYQLKVKQVNASIAASKKRNPSPSPDPNDKVVNTTYCMTPKAFSSKKGFNEYNALLTQIAKQGGIKTSILNEYLSQGQKSGVFSSKDVSAIKKQFGI